jgi:hypothetical protein
MSFIFFLRFMPTRVSKAQRTDAMENAMVPRYSKFSISFAFSNLSKPGKALFLALIHLFIYFPFFSQRVASKNRKSRDTCDTRPRPCRFNGFESVCAIQPGLFFVRLWCLRTPTCKSRIGMNRRRPRERGGLELKP